MGWPSILELHEQIFSGKVTILELVEKSLKAADDTKDKHAILQVFGEFARVKAVELQNNLQANKDKPLYGIPVVVKDNILTFGGQTTASAKMLENFEAPYQATVIEKLETAGAIVVAKANLDAFAHGSSTENSDFGPTKNPYDDERVPGGSSGGSAAAVALNIAPLAIGTDTGGSIRLPASYCGVVGYKPSYGLVSRYGVVAMASSCDVVGLLASSVKDIEIAMDVMSGKDTKDSTTIEKEASYQTEKTSLSGLTVGVIEQHMADGLSDEVRTSIEQAIEQLKQAGATVKTVSLPMLKYALASYYIIMPAEVSSNLSRYDGLRYGLHAKTAKTLNQAYEETRTNGFNQEVVRRVLLGTFVLSSGFYDAYYKKAQTVRTLIAQEFKQALKECDVLIGPTASDIAFKFGENTSDPIKMYMSDIMTVGANLAGVPAISIPIKEGKSNMPIGLQIIGAQAQDAKLLSIADSIENVIGKNGGEK